MSHQKILWIGVAVGWIGLLIIFGILPFPKELTILSLIGLLMIMWGTTEEKKKEKGMTTAQKGILLFGFGLLIFFVGASLSPITSLIGGLLIAVGVFIWALNKNYDS
ncbi:MAG: hypothetical protein ACYC9M_09900 [Desulfobulbaceae bacterium]